MLALSPQNDDGSEGIPDLSGIFLADIGSLLGFQEFFHTAGSYGNEGRCPRYATLSLVLSRCPLIIRYSEQQINHMSKLSTGLSIYVIVSTPAVEIVHLTAHYALQRADLILDERPIRLVIFVFYPPHKMQHSNFEDKLARLDLIQTPARQQPLRVGMIYST